MSQETETVNPAERLLARYGFKIERPAPIEPGSFGLGLMDFLPCPAPGEAVTADEGTISVEDIQHFAPFGGRDRQAFDSAEAAEEAVLGDFKTFLLQAKEAGHDTFFMRAPFEVISDKDFATMRTKYTAYVRGCTWKAKAAA